MNNMVVVNSVRFILLVILQVFVLSHINFLGYINPYLYLLFVLLLPLNLNQWKVLLASFAIGIVIDIFQDTGGANAAAALTAAFLRPGILKFAFGISFEHQNIKFYQTPFAQRLTYVFLMVLVHHLVLFLLLFFNLNYWMEILKNTLFSGLFSIVIIIASMSFFRERRR